MSSIYNSMIKGALAGATFGYAFNLMDLTPQTCGGLWVDIPCSDSIYKHYAQNHPGGCQTFEMDCKYAISPITVMVGFAAFGALVGLISNVAKRCW